MYLTHEQEPKTIAHIKQHLQYLGITPGIQGNSSLWIPLSLFWGLLFAVPEIGQFEKEILNDSSGDDILTQLDYVTKSVRPMYMMREIQYIHVSVRSHALCLNLDNYKL